MKTHFKTASCFFMILFSCANVYGGKIKGSPHDLTALDKPNACNYCHTPHGAMRQTPLWSHKLSNTVYKIYQSSTLEAKVGQPTGSSKMCLSCHDGTVALTHTKGGRGSGVFITPGDSNLGTDLSDDHPISFIYSDQLAAKDTQLRTSSELPSQFMLDKNKEVQCTTCHDPHDNQYGNFLRMSNSYSQICVACHNLEEWNNSVHQSSNASVAQAQDQYLRKSEFGSVSENGCNSCHRSHSAGGNERLLHFERSEENCLSCHNGAVAKTDLRPSISKFSKHNVKKYNKIHDPKESANHAVMHVECVDCHNPHSATNDPASAPMASGLIKNVSGVTALGSSIDRILYQYELCFKCHGDNTDRVHSKITRVITQTNTRLEFDPGNPSFHPVVEQGVNNNVPSLISTLNRDDLIYCTDCHSAEQGSSVKGPHGSIHSNLLAYNYETIDYTNESYLSYELCYKCHSRNSILNNESFTKHKEHLDEKIPCSACHDPHGISNSQGNSTNNTHLINFDRNIVKVEPASGRLEFIDNGTFSGQCYLQCHGENHSPKQY